VSKPIGQIVDKLRFTGDVEKDQAVIRRALKRIKRAINREANNQD
jgi:hypothetical protein